MDEATFTDPAWWWEHRAEAFEALAEASWSAFMREVDPKERLVYSVQRELVVATFETWWDKYRITLGTIEAGCDLAAEKLRGFLAGLGYG